MKRGFTLIELLAVIVILAIIALIATPIILNIINDAKQESQERSIELYASAIKNGIAAYQLREGKEVAAGTYTTDSLPLEVEYEGDIECSTIDIYTDGGVYVAGCTVNGDEIDYTYGTKQVVKGKLSSVCNPVSVQTEGTYTAGDKYECKVDPNKDAYTFYVLTTAAEGATSVNLIMDSNITSTGNAIKDSNPTDKGLVAWINNSHFLEMGGSQTDWDNYENMNVYGPITAMNHLATATASWTNLNTMTVSTFTDDTGATHQMAKTYTTYARLPYYSEISNVSSTTLYLIDYLYGDEDTDLGITGRNGVSGVYGYWTLSSNASDSLNAWNVYYDGNASDDDVNYDGNYGVRPVITLSI